MYSEALKDFILAQRRPAGGQQEVNYKHGEVGRIISSLAQLPPGSSIATAYHMYQNRSAIPRDPISPTSAARGYARGACDGPGKCLCECHRAPNGAPCPRCRGRVTQASKAIFPLLDLSGALPGRENYHVLLRKAECLFYLEDYIGCVRSCSLGIDEFDFEKYTSRGVLYISNAANLLRTNQPLRETSLERITKSSDNALSQEETDSLCAKAEFPLTKEDRELLYNFYFLRARALTMLNRIEQSARDCSRALHVLTGRAGARDGGAGTAEGNVGLGALLFFMAKNYCFLRLYTKAYHHARDAVRAGLPYYAVHRAHYVAGVALMYTGRRRLAARCFSLALRTHFMARFAPLVYETMQGEGVISLPSLETIAHFVEQYPAYDPVDYAIFPKEGERDVEGEDQPPDPGALGLGSTTPAKTTKFQTFNTLFPSAASRPKSSELHRIKPYPSLPPPVPEKDYQEKVESFFENKLRYICGQVEGSTLKRLAGQLTKAASTIDDYLVVGNRVNAACNAGYRSGPLRFAITNTWVCPENVFYLHERAKCLQEMGLHELAVDDFTTVLRFQPHNARAFFRRAFSLRALGFFEEAALDFEQARTLCPAEEVFQVDYQKISKLGYVEVAPYGNEEHYYEELLASGQLAVPPDAPPSSKGPREQGPASLPHITPYALTGTSLQERVRVTAFAQLTDENVHRILSSVTEGAVFTRPVVPPGPGLEDSRFQDDESLGTSSVSAPPAGVTPLRIRLG